MTDIGDDLLIANIMYKPVYVGGTYAEALRTLTCKQLRLIYKALKIPKPRAKQPRKSHLINTIVTFTTETIYTTHTENGQELLDKSTLEHYVYLLKIFSPGRKDEFKTTLPDLYYVNQELKERFESVIEGSDRELTDKARYSWLVTQDIYDGSWQSSNSGQRCLQRVLKIVMEDVIQSLSKNKTLVCEDGEEMPVYGYLGWSDCKENFSINPSSGCCTNKNNLTILNIDNIVAKCKGPGCPALSREESQVVDSLKTSNESNIEGISSKLDPDPKKANAQLEAANKVQANLFSKISDYLADMLDDGVICAEGETIDSMQAEKVVKGGWTKEVLKKMLTVMGGLVDRLQQTWVVVAANGTVRKITSMVEKIAKFLTSSPAVVNAILFMVNIALDTVAGSLIQYFDEKTIFVHMEEYLVHHLKSYPNSFMGTQARINLIIKENKQTQQAADDAAFEMRRDAFEMNMRGTSDINMGMSTLEDAPLAISPTAPPTNIEKPTVNPTAEVMTSPLSSVKMNSSTGWGMDVVGQVKTYLEGYVLGLFDNLKNIASMLQNLQANMVQKIKSMAGSISDSIKHTYDSISKLIAMVLKAIKSMEEKVKTKMVTAYKSAVRNGHAALNAAQRFLESAGDSVLIGTIGSSPTAALKAVTNTSMRYMQEMGPKRTILKAISMLSPETFMDTIKDVIRLVFMPLSWIPGMGEALIQTTTSFVQVLVRPMASEIINIVKFVVTGLDIFSNFELLARIFSLHRFVTSFAYLENVYPVTYGAFIDMHNVQKRMSSAVYLS